MAAAGRFESLGATLGNNRYLRIAAVADGTAVRGSSEGSSIIGRLMKLSELTVSVQVGGRNRLVDHAALFVFTSNTNGLRDPP